MTPRALSRLWLSICWVCLCHTVAFRQCLTGSGASISAERYVGALRLCFVGCKMVNGRSWRLWFQGNMVLLQLTVSSHCLQLLPVLRVS